MWGAYCEYTYLGENNGIKPGWDPIVKSDYKHKLSIRLSVPALFPIEVTTITRNLTLLQEHLKELLLYIVVLSYRSMNYTGMSCGVFRDAGDFCSMLLGLGS